MKTIFAQLMLIFLFVSTASAQVSVRAKIDPGEITLEDSSSITVVVTSNDDVVQLKKPNVMGLNFVQYGESSQVEDVNGRVSVSQVYFFRVVADEATDYTIGPFRVLVGRQWYESNQLKLKVKKVARTQPPKVMNPFQPNAIPQNPRSYQPPVNQPPPQDSPKIWVTAAVDKTQVYQQEQILYRVKLYTRMDVSNLDLDLPELNDFLFEMIEPGRRGKETVNNLVYTTWQQTYSLIPLKAGQLTMPATQMNVTVQEPTQNNFQKQGNGFYFKFSMGSRSVNKKLSSKPIELTIKPLPTPIPVNFTGLVGDFGLQTEVSSKDVKQGDTVTYTLTLSGAGNIKQALLPQIDWQGFKVYADKPELELLKSSVGLSGRKVFKMALIPQKSGQLTLPEITLSYFDPKEQQYKTLIAPTSQIQVTANAQAPGTRFTPSQPSSSSKSYSQTLPTSASLTDVANVSAGHFSIVWVWLAWLGVPLFWFLSSFWGRIKKANGKPKQTKNKALKKVLSAKVHDKSQVKSFLHDLKIYFAKNKSQTAEALTALDIKALLKDQGHGSWSESFVKAWQTLEGCEYGFVKDEDWQKAVQTIQTHLKEQA